MTNKFISYIIYIEHINKAPHKKGTRKKAEIMKLSKINDEYLKGGDMS